MSESSIIIGIVQNIAILLTFSMLYDYWWADDEKFKNLFVKILVGGVLGGIGIVLMLAPWTFYPGLVFDTRSIMLSVSGLFFGSIPTLIAMLVTGTYRFVMGGDGMWMGIAVIFSSGTIGILWQKLRFVREKKNNLFGLFTMGLLVHIVMLICTIFLPADKIWQTLKIIALPVIIIYPLGTMLLGFLMQSRKKHWFTRKALKESEERFRSYVDSAPVGVFVADENGNYTDVNDTTAFITGYSKTELLSMNLIDIIPSDGQDTAGKHFQKVVETGQSSGEIPFTKKNGSPGYWMINAVMLSDKRFLGFVTDITDRRQSELALHDSQKNFEDVTKNLPDGVLIANEDGKILFSNKRLQEMLGYTNEELLTMTGWDMTRTEDISVLKERMKKRLKGIGHIINYDRILIRKDGTEVFTDFSTTTTKWMGKTLPMAIIRDITEKKKIEKELEKYRENLEESVNERTKEIETKNIKVTESQQAMAYLLEDMNQASVQLRKSNEQLEIANKEMEAFSYSVSHDLRAPLTRMDGFSGALIDMYKDKIDEKGVHYLKRIKASSKLMAQLIDDMLSLSRISRQQISLSNINISNISNKIIKRYQRLEPERKIDIKIEDGIEINCDMQLITILFENVLSNAWKFTSKNTKTIIEIGTKTIKDKKVIFIKDNGVGFDMKYSEKVFMPFQRLHTESEFTGTGIGMATVFRIIKRHNANIWVESEAEDLSAGKAGGTTFYLNF
ncbi:MAG: PAS domain S-box protein [Bacteroidales bacterium]|nr:PAS domain S-box protein [Bacteroidales bacterium]